MIQRRKNLRFAFEPSDAFVILREGRGKNLDRDIAIELRVARAKHLPHPARAKGPGDFIRPEPRAEGEAQWGIPCRWRSDATWQLNGR